jgi:Ring finger domain
VLVRAVDAAATEYRGQNQAEHQQQNQSPPAHDLHAGQLCVTPDAPVLTMRNVVVAPGASFTFSLRPPLPAFAPAAYIFELQYDEGLYRDSRPDPLLLAAPGAIPDPFHVAVRQEDKDEMRVAEEVEVEGLGGDSSPRNSTNLELRAEAGDTDALRADDDEAAAVIENVSRRVEQQVYRSDAESFIVWRSFAHLVVRNVSSETEWFVRVLNHNGTVMNALNATLSIRMEVPLSERVAFVNTGRAEALGVPSIPPAVQGMGYTLCPMGHLPGSTRPRSASSFEDDGAPLRKRRSATPWASKLGSNRLNTVMSEDIRDDAMFDRAGGVSEFGAASNLTDFGLLACSGRGACVKSKCVCGADFQGRACESPVFDLPAGQISVHSDEMVYFRYMVPMDGAVAAMLRILPESNMASSPATSLSSQPILFAKRLGENGGRLLSRGPPLPTTYDTHFSDRVAFRARLPTQAVVRRHLSRGDILYLGVFNYHRPAPEWLLHSRYTSRRLRDGVSGRNMLLYPRRPVRVRLEVYPCEVRQLFVRSHYGSRALFGPTSLGSPASGKIDTLRGDKNETAGESRMEDGEGKSAFDISSMMAMDFGGTHPHLTRACPVPLTASHWETSLSFLMLPLMLGTFTMLTMVVCITTWARIFRLQILRAVQGRFPGDEELLTGGTLGSRRYPRQDQLTDAEVNAMFPAFLYVKDQASALGACGDPTCSVCLCSYEESEALRRLGCGHVYHASCLDQWLRTNATCPRCRKSARIVEVHVDALARAQYWLRFAVARSMRLYMYATSRWRGDPHRQHVSAEYSRLDGRVSPDLTSNAI